MLLLRHCMAVRRKLIHHGGYSEVPKLAWERSVTNEEENYA